MSGKSAVFELVANLRNMGVKIAADESGNISIKDPRKMLSKESLSILKESKSELLELLSKEESIETLAKEKEFSARYALSAGQARLWFLNVMQGGNDTTYNVPWVVRMNGQLNLSALEKAVERIVTRHTVLRSRIFIDRGVPYQEVSPLDLFTLEVIDISEENVVAEIRRRIQTAFKLDCAPLFKSAIFRIDDRHHILMLLSHHIVFDGASMETLLEELTTFYTESDRSDYVQAELPELTRYSDFVKWEKQWLTSIDCRQQLLYWKNKLHGLVDVPHKQLIDPASGTAAGLIKENVSGVIRRLMAFETADKIDNICKQLGVTRFTFLIAVYFLTLWSATGENDICVGIPVTGRHRKEFYKVIGFFANTVAIRQRIEHSWSLKEYVAAMSRTMNEALQNQFVPFDLVVRELNPVRNLNANPVFQTMFLLEASNSEMLLLGECEVSPLEEHFGSATAMFDFSFSVSEEKDGWYSGVWFNAGKYSPKYIEGFLRLYEKILIDLDVESKISIFVPSAASDSKPISNAVC